MTPRGHWPKRLRGTDTFCYTGTGFGDGFETIDWKWHMHMYWFMIPIKVWFWTVMYVYVYNWLCVGFSPLSGASYKALNFSQILWIALVRVWYQNSATEARSGQCRNSHLSLSIEAYRSHKTVVSYEVLFILLFVFDLVVISLIVLLHLHWLFKRAV